MASVMIVDAEALPNTPKAFQQYVSSYFKQRQVMGRNVYYALIKLDIDHYEYVRGGIAPSHMVNLTSYTEGLPKGVDLGKWIMQNEGKCLWTFTGGHDSDRVCKSYA